MSTCAGSIAYRRTYRLYVTEPNVVKFLRSRKISVVKRLRANAFTVVIRAILDDLTSRYAICA